MRSIIIIYAKHCYYSSHARNIVLTTTIWYSFHTRKTVILYTSVINFLLISAGGSAGF